MCQQGFKRKHLVLKLQIIVSLRDQAAYYGDSDCISKWAWLTPPPTPHPQCDQNTKLDLSPQKIVLPNCKLSFVKLSALSNAAN